VTDFVRTALALFLTVAPLGALPAFQSLTVTESRTQTALACSSAAFILLASLCLVADQLLDWLAVSAENFQLAAALIFLPHAFHMIARGNSSSPREAKAIGPWVWFLPLTTPLLVSPASAAAAVSYAARFGTTGSIAACALVIAFTAGALALIPVLSGRAALSLATFNRFCGALLVAVAIELAVDGVRSV
jgi:small neutral amino acid transporter SnatA (MarC family)